jgi:hypothetical protein
MYFFIGKPSKTIEVKSLFSAFSTLTLQKFYIAGWALPTKYSQSRLLTVGNAHPTPAILELTGGEVQKSNRK